jgi:hypothetical protein
VHRLGDALARWVLQADQAEQPQISLQLVGGSVHGGPVRQRSGRHRQDPQTASAHVLDVGAQVVGSTQREDGVGRAGDEHRRRFLVAHHDQGAPAGRVEGDPVPLGPCRRVGVEIKAGAQGEHAQRDFHRVTQRCPAPAAEHGPTLGAPRGGDGQLKHLAVDGPGHVAVRLVARAVHDRRPARRPDPNDRHLVGRQTSGLVGADDGGGPEGLHRLQPPDQRVARGHRVRGPAQ